MAYRQIETPKQVKRVLQDMTTKNLTFIQNGATAHLAIPCWYQEIRHPQHTHVHDREWHDHLGWPDPVRPDESSQDAYLLRDGTAPYRYDYAEEGWNHAGRYINMSQMHPIHLRKEGYSDVEIAFVEPPQGLVASGRIDQSDDWVVRFVIEPNCNAALKDDIDVQYAVFVKGTINGQKRRDVIARGTLRILAGPTV